MGLAAGVHLAVTVCRHWPSILAAFLWSEPWRAVEEGLRLPSGEMSAFDDFVATLAWDELSCAAVAAVAAAGTIRFARMVFVSFKTLT